MTDKPLLELDNISKYSGNIIALTGVTTSVNAGEVTCVLGDNGAGKSTFIKILAGVHQQSEGTITMEGEPMSFASPRDSLDAGIATVKRGRPRHRIEVIRAIGVVELQSVSVSRRYIHSKVQSPGVATLNIHRRRVVAL